MRIVNTDKRLGGKRLVVYLALSSALLWSAGCAENESPHERIPHSHQLPYTEVIGNYHARLVVDREEKKLYLLFEDITEEPIELLKADRIMGKATLKNGAVKEEIFLPTPPLFNVFRKHQWSERTAGVYIADAPWLSDADRFRLDVEVPLRGVIHKLTFSLGQPE